MSTLFLILSGLFGVGALGFLAWSLIPLVSEVNRTARTVAESIARIQDAVTGIREEEGRIRNDLSLLSGAATSWPQAAGLPVEAGLLVRNIRALGAATALLSTLRRVPWL